MIAEQNSNPSIGVTFLQTADAFNYYEMLYESAKTIRSYCRRHSFRYECYIGLKRGYFSWHSVFNRIVLLKEIIERGVTEWIIYLDADALVINQEFDLPSYLSGKAAYGAIFAPSGVTSNLWDVNAGVLFFNASSSWAAAFINRWYDAFMRISDNDLKIAWSWEHSIQNDQGLLQDLLAREPEIERHVYFESASLINNTSPSLQADSPTFIWQVTRSQSSRTLNHRLGLIKDKIKEILREIYQQPSELLIPELNREQQIAIVAALYDALLGRVPDPAGIETYSGVLREEGLDFGLRRVIGYILDSEEFRAKASRLISK
jgi:hypothetical protein